MSGYTTVQKQGDSALFQDRTNIAKNNANSFNPNVANPFLVTTFAPPNLGLYAKNSVVDDISSIISSINSQIGSVIDYSNFILK